MDQQRNASKPSAPPDDFPRFVLGAQARYGQLARSLLWQHTLSHGPQWKDWLQGPDGFPAYPALPSGPKATLWDGWLCESDLWPAMDTDGTADRMRSLWRETLLRRRMDAEGNVETDQGLYYAHPYGWPFPNWQQGAGVGWHFSYHGQAGALETPAAMAYRPRGLAEPAAFGRGGLSAPASTECGAQWTVQDGDTVYLETPPFALDADQGPFLQLRWFGQGFSGTPRVAFLREGDPDYLPGNEMVCPSLPERFEHREEAFALLPLYRHPGYQGRIERFRLYPGRARVGARLTVTGVCTLYDTRHNVNTPQYLRGCCDYFAWTQDVHFLQAALPKMRKALRAYRYAHHIREQGVVLTDWVGHEGRTGVWFDRDGHKRVKPGHSLHNNWLDLLPCGHLDCYATVFYYAALCRMAALEAAVLDHPQWNIPEAFDAESPDALAREADRVRRTANERFWNSETGRFCLSVDADGVPHDVGCTLVNLEAVAAGLADPPHARSILDWIAGRRIVAGDTSTGADLYAFGFAPRITTRRNLDYWYWGWSQPETIPFGAQIQEGGAALAFSYFDILARLRVYGPDDAWERTRALLDWYEQVCAEGGYAAYYANRALSLQGGGAAGGIGITSEFFESLLPMQALLRGFLGLEALPDRLHFSPRIPTALGRVGVSRIRWGEATLDVLAEAGTLRVTVEGPLPGPLTCAPGWSLEVR